MKKLDWGRDVLLGGGVLMLAVIIASLMPAKGVLAAPGAQQATASPASGCAVATPICITVTPVPTATPAPVQMSVATPVGAQVVDSRGGWFYCGSWSLNVPAYGVPNNSAVHCGAFDSTRAPAAPSGYQLLRHTINVNIYNDQSEWITTFNLPLTFCMPYSADDLSAAGNDPSRLTVVTAPMNGAWSALATSINLSTKQVCATVNHLTLFDLAVRGATPTSTGPSLGTGGPLPVAGGRYVVQQGDTLFGLARRLGTTVAALKAANGLVSDWIYVGQTLVIPSGQLQATPVPTARPATTATPVGTKPATYVVQAGDNLFRLGLRFGVSVSALQAANKLNTTLIYVGQVLVIP